MLSSVLNSDRAIEVNIIIMRALGRIRGMLAGHKDLAGKLEELEAKYQEHDFQIKAVFDAIHNLLKPPKSKSRPIGFLAEEKKK